MCPDSNLFEPTNPEEDLFAESGGPHIFGAGSHICGTDTRGYATPDNFDEKELVLHRTQGFIPLWRPNTTLRFRFSPTLYQNFSKADKIIAWIRKILAEGILEWGDAVPIGFREDHDLWDFEIIVAPSNCSPYGCTLARAFFPDSGRHALTIFPELSKQSPQEQRETMAHELGHIFGLRHFFAQVKEKKAPSVLFGKHSKFTIMNYGPNSRMTEQDQADLKLLYQSVWSGKLRHIGGTPIALFYPYHKLGLKAIEQVEI